MKDLTTQEMLDVNGGGPYVDAVVELGERAYEAWEVHHEHHHAGSHYHEPSHSDHEEHTLD